MIRRGWMTPRSIATTIMPLALVLLMACGGVAGVATRTPQIEPKAALESAVLTTPIPQVQTIFQAPVVASTSEPAPIQVTLDSTDQTEEPLGDVPAAVQEVKEIDPDAIVAAFETVLGRIYEDSLNSVVQIRVAQQFDPQQGGEFVNPFADPNNPDEDFFSRGEGSGFVWDSQGHIVTNRHVVADADRVTVIFANGSEVEADVVGVDTDSDLAVLKIEFPTDDIVPVQLGDSDEVKVGQTAVAIGNPFSQDFTLTSGIVSAVGRTIRSGASQYSIPAVIQTDASINPGNSGGPLLNRKGEVIGINTQMISRSGSNSGIGFAVPINVAKTVVPSLIGDGQFDYAWLGISGGTVSGRVAGLMDLPSDTRGALVILLAPDGPAETAGMRASESVERIDGFNVPYGGDVIIGIDGDSIRSMDDLIAYLVANTRPGDVIIMEVMRPGGEVVEIEVTLGTRPR